MKKKIVFLSHTPLNSFYKVGSYHLSKILSKEHEILYITSPISCFHFLKGITNSEYRRTILKKKTESLKLEEYEGIKTITPFVLIPYRGIFPFDNAAIPLKYSSFFLGQMKSVLDKIGFSKVDFVIQDSPILFYLKDLFQDAKWIYRVTDDYLTMPKAPKTLGVIEDKIVKRSDKIIVTSNVLREIIEERYSRESLVLENGVDSSFFGIKSEASTDKNIQCIYIGSIDDRFDYTLFNELAENNRTINFTIIGKKTDKINDQSNVKKIGFVDHKDLLKYLVKADIGLMPFDINHPGNLTRSPMKIYEYAACGLPVVSTPIKEVVDRKHDFVLFANDASGFKKQIEHAFNNDDLIKNARIIAEERSWEIIAAKLYKYISNE